MRVIAYLPVGQGNPDNLAAKRVVRFSRCQDIGNVKKRPCFIGSLVAVSITLGLVRGLGLVLSTEIDNMCIWAMPVVRVYALHMRELPTFPCVWITSSVSIRSSMTKV